MYAQAEPRAWWERSRADPQAEQEWFFMTTHKSRALDATQHAQAVREVRRDAEGAYTQVQSRLRTSKFGLCVFVVI